MVYDTGGIRVRVRVGMLSQHCDLDVHDDDGHQEDGRELATEHLGLLQSFERLAQLGHLRGRSQISRIPLITLRIRFLCICT